MTSPPAPTASEAEKLGPYRILLDDWISCAPFEQLLDMRILGAAGGKAELQMPFRYCLANGGSLLHGGALVSLADTAAVMALKSCVPVGSHFATTELQVSFLAPVTSGQVRALAQVRPAGERCWDASVELFNDAGVRVLRMTAQLRLARRQPYDTSAA
ncbi:MAG: PaaI family thioesterase [Desulfuromonas sp.]|jgi:uncharacterized protein (TIGR00369 family)|nr:PaaI family thioesterase [Desulfuromonas thiophila]MDY0398604.1 PaaI family thioesterase [Desulfuromonas thiophila]